MKKRILSWGLILSLLLTMLPATAGAAEGGCTCGAQADAAGVIVHEETCPLYEAPTADESPAEEPGPDVPGFSPMGEAAPLAEAEHTPGDHGSWTPLTSQTELSTGNYYLEDDLDAGNQQIKVTGEVNLCLNGHTFTGEASYGIFRVGTGGTLNIYDCIGTGSIQSTNHNPVLLHSGGVCNLYSGTLSSGITAVVIDSDGANNQEGGTFNLYGGTVKSTASDKQGIYVYAGLTNAKVNLYGGTVSGNYAVNAGSGTVTLSGSPKLEGTAADIYLPNSAPGWPQRTRWTARSAWTWPPPAYSPAGTWRPIRATSPPPTPATM